MMNETIRIAISSAGRRGELIDCFRASARDLELDLKVFALDLDPTMSPACHLADEAFRVPRCTADGFPEFVLEICRKHEIDVLVPTIDTELPIFSEWKDRYASIGTAVVVSEASFIRLCRDKLATAANLAAIGVQAPRSTTWHAFRSSLEDWDFPLILKPNAGSRSIGVRKISTYEDLPEDIADPDSHMIQEFVSGAEFTINCYAAGDGRLITAVPHHRVEVRDGEVSKGVTRRIGILHDYAQAICTNIKGIRGPFCFQAIMPDDAASSVFEINGRFGGGYPLAHHAGAHFTEWILREYLNLPLPERVDWKPGLKMLRYDSSIIF